MEVISASHQLDQIPHRDTFAKYNLLTRGQEIAVDVDQSRCVRLDLEPGEISLHHVRLVHGSPPLPHTVLPKRPRCCVRRARLTIRLRLPLVRPAL